MECTAAIAMSYPSTEDRGDSSRRSARNSKFRKRSRAPHDNAIQSLGPMHQAAGPALDLISGRCALKESQTLFSTPPYSSRTVENPHRRKMTRLRRSDRNTPPPKQTVKKKLLVRSPRQSALTDTKDSTTRALMARIAEMEQRLSSHPQSSNPPAAVVMQTAGGVAGPTQDDINDMRSHGRDIIEKRMEKGDIPVGATSSRLKSSLVRDVVEEIHAVTPSVPKRQVSMYLTSRLAYLKNTKATEGRWKQKFTKQHPDGYFARYEGPARGFRLFGRGESLITAAETEAILNYQEAGRPKSGPLYDAVKSINGWTKESIPDDGEGEEEEKKVKVEEPPPQKQKVCTAAGTVVPNNWNCESTGFFK